MGTVPPPDAQPERPSTATTTPACHTRLAIVPTLRSSSKTGPQLSSREAHESRAKLQNDVRYFTGICISTSGEFAMSPLNTCPAGPLGV